jgi:hypothetical protein
MVPITVWYRQIISIEPWAEELFNMPFEESMSDPTLNLRFGWLLYEATEENHGCGWQPWKMC